MLVSAAGVTAQDAVWRLVARAQRADALEPVSVVVPSTVAGLQLRRAFTRAERRGLANVRMVLLHELAFTIAQPRLARLGLTPQPPLLERELVRAALYDASSEVASLRGLERHPATIDAITATLADLAGLDEAGLARLDARGGRAAMIAAVERARRARARDASYDHERLLQEAAIAIERGEESRAAAGRVILYAPHRPTPGGIALWRALAARGRLDAVVIHLSDTTSDAYEATTTDLLRSLLDDPLDITHNTDAPAPTTHLVDAPSAHDEVRWVAADLTKRVERGLRVSDAAIVVRATDLYPRIVAQVFDAASIPWVGRSPHTLASSSAGRALLGALALAGGELRRDAVFRWLASAPIVDPATESSVPAPYWDVVSRRAGVVGDSWDAPLRRHAEAQRAEGSAREANAAARLADFVGALDRALRTPADGGWHAWAAWAAGIVQQYLPAPSLRLDGGDEHDEEARDAEAHAQVLDVVHGLAALDAAGTTPTLDQFTRTIATALDVPAGRVGRFGEGVLVASPVDLRGCNFEVVYVLGMAEGRYPPRGLEDPLLNDTDRAAVAAGIPLQRERAARERTDHLHALGSAATHVLAFPRADVREQRVHRAAPLLLEAASALAGRPVGAEAVLDLDAPWCTHVESFGASLHEAGTSLPLGEALLRGIDARRRAHLDPATHPALRALPVAARGFAMVTARAADVHGEYDGVIGTLDGLRSRAPLSPTALERWATCGFAYFLQRVLYVDVVERPERIDELSAIDRGVLLHEIFDRFVREAAPPATPDEPWSRAARAQLARITAECCDDAERRGITGNPLVWRRRRRAIEQVTATFCDSDEQWRAALGVVPWRTELEFGLDEGDAEAALAVTLPGGGEVRFRGRIDRVDRSPDGRALVVTDYKTGRLPARQSGSVFDPVAGGRSLQLAVYGMVAERLAPGAEVSAHYRWVSYPEEPPDPPFASFAVTRHRLREVVEGIVDGIDHGVFPADPGSSSYDVRNRRDTFDNCRNCPFDPLCPTDRGEAQARKQHDPQLAPLRSLDCSQEELEALIERTESEPA